VNASTAVELTVEELHFLAAAHGLSAVPGLGPLPCEPDDEELLGLLAGTAARSLIGRGLGVYDASGEFLIATELLPLLDVYLDPEWVISALRVADGERGARTWTASGPAVTELVQLAAGAYGLVSAAPEDVRDLVAEFLELSGDDAGEGEAEQIDESRVSVLVEARRVQLAGEGADGVALSWADPGDGPRVWVLSDEEADSVFGTPTGRRRVLDALTG
jgi:hypothetical protein